MKSISLKLLVSSAIACMPCVVAAQNAGPITVVVPFGPGASADVMMRLVTSKVTQQTQQQVIVENKPGASGIIGAEQVKNANSQNPVLFQSSIGTHGVNPPLFGPKLPYDAVKDFKSVGMLWRFPSVLAVPTQSGITDVAGLLKAADRPNSLTYGSPGIGTGGHLLGAMLSKAVGKPMTHIPYKGAAPAVVDLAGNRIDFMFASYASFRSLVDEGRVRILAVASDKRLELLPNVPTLEELQVKDVDVMNWFGLSAPKTTSDETVAHLSRVFADAVRDPDVVKRMKDEGVEAVGGTPEAYAREIQREIDRYTTVIKEFGITAQ